MVHKWFTGLCCGCTSTNDTERPRRPKEVTFQEIIDKIHDIVLGDRRLKIRELSDIVRISTERIFHTLHDCLGMRRLSARWISPLLTLDQKQSRVNMCQQCLDMYQRNPSEFFRR